jgi:hypothetical protein
VPFSALALLAGDTRLLPMGLRLQTIGRAATRTLRRLHPHADHQRARCETLCATAWACWPEGTPYAVSGAQPRWRGLSSVQPLRRWVRHSPWAIRRCCGWQGSSGMPFLDPFLAQCCQRSA